MRAPAIRIASLHFTYESPGRGYNGALISSFQESTTSQAAEKLEALARAEFGDLKPAEVAVIRAATTESSALCGPSHDLRDPSNNPAFSENGKGAVRPWGTEREIRAEVLRWLCIDGDASALVDPRGVQVLGARIVGELDLRHAEVAFPLTLVHCRLMEDAYFVGCEIPRVDLEGSRTRSIIADAVRMKQSLFLRDLRCEGVVSLVLAQIDGTLTCEGAVILGSDGIAISADGIHVGGDVFLCAGSNIPGVLKPFCAKGSARFVGAELKGDLDCRGGQFRSRRGEALTLERASVGGEIFFCSAREESSEAKCPFKVKGNLDLTGLSANAIEDEDACWPGAGKLNLDGFSYTRLSPKDAESRLKWLALDQSDATQPYRQLAKVLQDSGNAKNAERVLIAMEKKLSSKDWLRGLKALIGYGYRPGNAVWWLLGLWAIGAWVGLNSYAMGSMVPTDKDAYASFAVSRAAPASYPRFQPVMFSLENTFPLVKLGQADKWQADPAGSAEWKSVGEWVGSAGFTRWFIWIQILLGWLFATLFVAAVSGIVQHD